MSKPRHADAHIHLFENGFRGALTARPGVTIDEVACYQSFASEFGIQAALVVGYEGKTWAKGNNAFLLRLTKQHEWIYPLMFVDLARGISIKQLEQWHAQRAAGISLYIFDEQHANALSAIPEAIWRCLENHHWLISLNTAPEYLTAWQPILQTYSQINLLISHLGLPLCVASPLSDSAAKQQLQHILALSAYASIHVKLSAFYALTAPGHDYPHRAAWPYVKTLAEHFGTHRLLWGSDFPSYMDAVSFPQTLGLLKHMPFLSQNDRQQIHGNNLMRILSRR